MFTPRSLTPQMVEQIIEQTARERREQGLPERIEDPAVLAKVARLARPGARDED